MPTNPQMSRKARIVLMISVILGLTRLAAVSRSLWDWDEAQFALAVSQYDVRLHRPHPPGYPIFVAAAKVLDAAMGLDDFRCVQIVSVLASLFVFPACFHLAREMGFGFGTSVYGAVITAMLPNVWVYGGTAHSDVPALVAGVMACALLLRSGTTLTTTPYVAAWLLFGVGVAIRPTTVLLGIIPLVIVTYRRGRARWRSAIAGATIALLAAGGSYAAAAVASGGMQAFRHAFVLQAAWVRDVDSPANAGRPPLLSLLWTFFVAPVDEPKLFVPMAGLSIAAIVHAIRQKKQAVAATVSIFLPIAVFSWLTLDVSCVGRYAIQYLPMHAMLTSHGCAVLANVLSSRRQAALQGTLALLVALSAAAWTLPGVAELVRTDSPPVRAMAWAMRTAPPEARIYVHEGLRPQAQYSIPLGRLRLYNELAEITEHNAYVVSPVPVHGAMVFTRQRAPLWSIVRQRNFEVYALPLSTAKVEFGQGWYAPEGSGARMWRWMAHESVTELPAVRSTGKLTLDIYAPLDALRARPTVRIYFNDALIDEIPVVTANITRSWILQSREDRNTLRITTSGTVNPAADLGLKDARLLGVRLDALHWTDQPKG